MKSEGGCGQSEERWTPASSSDGGCEEGPIHRLMEDAESEER